MANESQNQDGNPLENFAAAASQELGEQPISLSETMVEHVAGGQVSLHQSGVRSLQASALRLEESGAGFVRAGTIDVHNSGIGVAVARRMTLQEANSSVVVAQEVQATDVRTLALFAARVSGNISTVFTPVTALLAGAGFGLITWLLRRAFQNPNSAQ
ncbi:MAG: hypothetical protein H6642_17205 [Caldilineaceae bacterium]|nr:hypothetical protein [Caldilineaceae bacterium]MCB9140082.1 hypothetical protein [Caldilineaceae bacterium]